MKLGVFMFTAHYAMDLPALGIAAEERGFNSLWVPEHTHMPSSRITPFPFGKELPDEYKHNLDPYVALAAVAAVTKTLRLGTGISLIIQRDPITLAKSVASLDHLSGGRVDFGIGGGWNREEMENHGTDYTRRWKLMRERTEAMKAIWTEEQATYHGEFVNFDSIWSWPKPVQSPHPPVLIGGDGERTLQRVVRYGDAWMPVPTKRESFAPRIRELTELAAKAGRAPIPVHLMGCPDDGDLLRQFKEDGVAECVLWLPPAKESIVLPRLDKLAELVPQLA